MARGRVILTNFGNSVDRWYHSGLTSFIFSPCHFQHFDFDLKCVYSQLQVGYSKPKHHLPAWLFIHVHLFSKIENQEILQAVSLADLPPPPHFMDNDCVTKPFLNQSPARSIDYHSWFRSIAFAMVLRRASFEDSGHQLPEQNQTLISVGEAE